MLAALSLPLAAAPERFAIDPERTIPAFEVSRLGISPLRGQFQRVTGTISLDREARAGSITIEIDATSVGIASRWFDGVLKGHDFFDIAHHPRLWYRADRIDFDGETPVRAEGEITLRGITRPLSLELRHFTCTPRDASPRAACAAEIVAHISRAAFGMTSYSPFIGDDVLLMIQVEAKEEKWK
jgi:polyisoprenoid-binding protein YceI